MWLSAKLGTVLTYLLLMQGVVVKSEISLCHSSAAPEFEGRKRRPVAIKMEKLVVVRMR